MNTSTKYATGCFFLLMTLFCIMSLYDIFFLRGNVYVRVRVPLTEEDILNLSAPMSFFGGGSLSIVGKGKTYRGTCKSTGKSTVIAFFASDNSGGDSGNAIMTENVCKNLLRTLIPINSVFYTENVPSTLYQQGITSLEEFFDGATSDGCTVYQFLFRYGSDGLTFFIRVKDDHLLYCVKQFTPYGDSVVSLYAGGKKNEFVEIIESIEKKFED